MKTQTVVQKEYLANALGYNETIYTLRSGVLLKMTDTEVSETIQKLLRKNCYENSFQGER